MQNKCLLSEALRMVSQQNYSKGTVVDFIDENAECVVSFVSDENNVYHATDNDSFIAKISDIYVVTPTFEKSFK